MNQGFSKFFCLLMEGSGAGFVEINYGFRSRRSENIRIRKHPDPKHWFNVSAYRIQFPTVLQIQIRNLVLFDPWIRESGQVFFESKSPQFFGYKLKVLCPLAHIFFVYRQIGLFRHLFRTKHFFHEFSSRCPIFFS